MDLLIKMTGLWGVAYIDQNSCNRVNSASQANAHENNRLNIRWLIPNFMPHCNMVCHALSWAKLCLAAFLFAGHWLEVIELFVAVRAKRFKLRKVTVKKWFAGTLFAEPHHLHVHIFSVRQNGIISFIITRGMELTNEDRATGMLFWLRIPVGDKLFFDRYIIIRSYIFPIAHFRSHNISCWLQF